MLLLLGETHNSYQSGQDVVKIKIISGLRDPDARLRVTDGIKKYEQFHWNYYELYNLEVKQWLSETVH